MDGWDSLAVTIWLQGIQIHAPIDEWNLKKKKKWNMCCKSNKLLACMTKEGEEPYWWRRCHCHNIHVRNFVRGTELVAESHSQSLVLSKLGRGSVLLSITPSHLIKRTHHSTSHFHMWYSAYLYHGNNIHWLSL
jgi:hypothetical protein